MKKRTIIPDSIKVIIPIRKRTTTARKRRIEIKRIAASGRKPGSKVWRKMA